MPEKPVEGQAPISPAPQVAAAAPAPAPGDAPGQHAQHTIKVGDKEFRADDVQGILNAKAGLEAEKNELKKKLDAYETEKLSEKEKAEKRTKDLETENAALKKSVFTSKVQRALDAKGIKVNASILALDVMDESQIDAAVQKLVTENPGLAGKPAGPDQHLPPGSHSPTDAPPATDREEDFKKRFDEARTDAEFEKIDAEYRAYRGIKPPGGRQVI
jgi:hypothetical protein